MFKFNKSSILILILGAAIIGALFFFSPKSKTSPHADSATQLPLIAIANYGPHPSLDTSIRGMKEYLAQQGLRANETINFDLSSVNFDQSLILQMLSKLQANDPQVLVAVGTPIAQAAKNTIKDIPIVFTDITDPVAAGLLQKSGQASRNLTGASDRQDLGAMLRFAKLLLPQAKTVGLLYATAEANDAALLTMMKEAAAAENLQVFALPVNEARDVPQRMQAFAGKVDFIYVGVSGAIQPSLPAIAASAHKMNIPVFNADSDAVLHGQVLASYGVDYYQVGVNTAKIIIQILNGVPVAQLAPIYPTAADHHAFISKSRAKDLGISLPANLPAQVKLVD